MWVNETSPNMPTLSGIHCTYTILSMTSVPSVKNNTESESKLTRLQHIINLQELFYSKKNLGWESHGLFIAYKTFLNKSSIRIFMYTC